MVDSTLKVHVYYGISRHPLSQSLSRVVGSQQSPIICAQTGQPKKGVGAKESVQNVLYPLLEDGDRLFREDGLYSDSWIYHQDGAAAHTSKETKEQMDH